MDSPITYRVSPQTAAAAAAAQVDTSTVAFANYSAGQRPFSGPPTTSSSQISSALSAALGPDPGIDTGLRTRPLICFNSDSEPPAAKNARVEDTEHFDNIKTNDDQSYRYPDNGPDALYLLESYSRQKATCIYARRPHAQAHGLRRQRCGREAAIQAHWHQWCTVGRRGDKSA